MNTGSDSSQSGGAAAWAVVALFCVALVAVGFFLIRSRTAVDRTRPPAATTQLREEEPPAAAPAPRAPMIQIAMPAVARAAVAAQPVAKRDAPRAWIGAPLANRTRRKLSVPRRRPCAARCREWMCNSIPSPARRNTSWRRGGFSLGRPRPPVRMRMRQLDDSSIPILTYSVISPRH